MPSSSRCWLILQRNLMKTYSVSYHGLLNITKVGCNFMQSHHESATESRPQDSDGSEEEPKKKLRAPYSYVPSRFKSTEEESPASIRLNRMIRKILKNKMENYIDSTFYKMVRANVENFFDGQDSSPEEKKLAETINKICDLYIEKISDTCSSVQFIRDDDKELISSPVFAVGSLPLRSYSDLMEFERKLQDEPGFRKSYVQYLRSVRMGKAKTTIYTMIGLSIAHNVACMYCGQRGGNNQKLIFTETELCKIILYEVAIMFPSVSNYALKRLVSKKLFQTGLNLRFRKPDVYALAMEELKAIRKETCIGEEHDGEK